MTSFLGVCLANIEGNLSHEALFQSRRGLFSGRHRRYEQRRYRKYAEYALIMRGGGVASLLMQYCLIAYFASAQIVVVVVVIYSGSSMII